MKLVIDNHEIVINNAYANRDTVTNLLSMIIEIPYDSMDYIELKLLFKNNVNDLTKVLDDGSSELYSGFTYYKINDDEENDQYQIILHGDESQFQDGRAKHLEKLLAKAESKLLDSLNTINEKNITIAEYESTISDKDKMIEQLNAELADIQQKLNM